MDYKQLAKEAICARKNAYTPYSSFRVGAALLCEDGSVYQGCNIENAAFGPTVCAERVAVFKAVSDGKRAFSALAVVGGKDKVASVTPCGVCRQVLSEFCGADFKVLLVQDEDGSYNETTLGALLPYAFGTNDLQG